MTDYLLRKKENAAVKQVSNLAEDDHCALGTCCCSKTAEKLLWAC